MAEVKLRALVLREVDFGDWDRYLTVLAEDGRRVEILCKNARRGKKTNPAARQLCLLYYSAVNSMEVISSPAGSLHL